MSIHDKNNDHSEMPVNEGWQQMQNILDVHLPIEKQKRKAFVWWWVSAAVMVTFISATILFWNDKNLPVAENVKTEVAAIENNSDNKNGSKTAELKDKVVDKKTVSDKQASDEKKLTLLNNTPSINGKKKTSHHHFIKKNVTEPLLKSDDENSAILAQNESRKQQLIDLEKGLPQLENEAEPNTESSVNKPQPLDSSEMKIAGKEEGIKVDTTLFSNTVDSVNAKSINVDSTNIAQHTNIIPLLTKPKKSIHIGVDAFEAQALSIGMQWPISKTFSFDLGIADIVKSNFLQDKKQPQYVLQNTSYQPQRMNFISINAGINTQLFPKWSIAVQPFFALLTHTSGNVFNYINTTPNSGTSLLSTSTLNAADSRTKFRTSIFKQVQTPYNNFDFGMRIRTAFQINNKCSVTAAYQFGLHPVAKKNYLVFRDGKFVSGYNNAAYNRFFMLGFAYKIQK